jgi:ABC-type dipeptide/oligopeptide/nickel transport system ATPase component
MTAILAIDALNVRFGVRGSIAAVRDVSLQVAAGECVGVVGESGSGKTQIFMAAMGLLPTDAQVAGAVQFAGQALLGRPRAELNRVRGSKLTMVFQDPMTSLTPHMRIGPQLAEPLVFHAGMSWRDAEAAALRMLERVRVPEAKRRMRQYPHELSGGMRQRVMIAMGIVCEPALLIADEPTTALDVTVQFEILRLLKEFQEEAGVAVLFVTHDLGVVAKICDTVSVIFGGRILEEGPTEQIFARPAHPYTAALIAASPRYDEPEKGLHPVPRELTAQLWRETAEYDEGRKHA